MRFGGKERVGKDKGQVKDERVNWLWARRKGLMGTGEEDEERIRQEMDKEKVFTGDKDKENIKGW